MQNWISVKGKPESIVLSSRIRIARNIKSIPFPHRLSEDKAREVIKIVENAFYTSSHTEGEYKSLYLYENEPDLNMAYLEKHLISSNLLENSKKAAFILNNDETISLMINEEDHIRLQCITAGLNLREAMDYADKLDDLLEERIDYAFDEKLGYLTACPTNLGTGLRASVMLHLPALSMSNEMNGVLNALTQVGMTIRGLYGEGSKAKGNLFQVSNQLTLGQCEEDILNNLNAVVTQIINQESISRQKLLEGYKYEVEDRIYRALGILKSAVLLNSSECLNLLSDVRMGVELGIINTVDISLLNELLVDTQPACLQLNMKVKLSERERDLNRARLVREKLKTAAVG
jgi:protein arginine kinase